MPNKLRFGLVDCNNFYVSCESVFQPDLKNKPVVVLSNNDGCVVSRSNLAKALQIKMGIPVFKIKEIVERHKVVCLSSNYTLYAGLSARVMQTLHQLVPTVEIYSIDEAFIDLSEFKPAQVLRLAREIVTTVKQWTGVPISLGIGPTKTLAKVANRIAKTNTKYSNIYLIEERNRNISLAQTSIEDIWGIGRKWSKKIYEMGIDNAYQLSLIDAEDIRKIANKTLAFTVLELQGTSVLEIEKVISPNKQIIASRSFGKEVTELQELKESVCFHLSRAMEKLRAQGCVAKHLTVFAQTDRFKANFHGYHYPININLPLPTQDTQKLLTLAMQGVDRIYCKGLKYKKTGVILSEISQKKQGQFDLFNEDTTKEESLMALLDEVNNKMGSGKLRFAIEGYDKRWRMKTESCSHRYTTCWSELPMVSAK